MATEDRCPCCKGYLEHDTDYMDHILMACFYDCKKCGWYSYYDTGNYEQSFAGRWLIYSHYTFSAEKMRKIRKLEIFRQKVWSKTWRVLKPLFLAANFAERYWHSVLKKKRIFK